MFASLPAPLEQEFIIWNRSRLDAEVWLGMGPGILSVRRRGFGEGRIARFVTKYILKKEVEKSKR